MKFDVEFEYEYFAEKFNADSKYYEEVFDDIMSFLNEEYGEDDSKDIPFDDEDLLVTIENDDDITGWGSKSYTSNTSLAYEKFFDFQDNNLKLLSDLLTDSFGKAEASFIIYNYFKKESVEGGFDVQLRLMLCRPVLEFIKNNVVVNGNILEDDEDYDEGFDESRKIRHKRRIR